MRTLAVVFLAALVMPGVAYTQTPMIIGHQVVSLGHVDFAFSEQMSRRSIEDAANSLLHPDGLPGEPLEKWAAFLAPDGVTMRLYLIDGMNSGDVYTLALDGVVSAEGEPVEEGYTYSFSAVDLVAPGLLGVEFLDDESIDLLYTEDIVESAGETVSNYLLYETASPPNVIGCTEVKMRGMYDRVSLSLDSPLSAGTSYTIEASGLYDPSGNPMPAGSAVTFTFENENEYPLIGLYTDGNRYNSAIDGEGIYSFDIWYWVRPGEDGTKLAAFAVDYPSNVIPEEIEPAPGSSVLGGDVFNGIMLGKDECAYEWTWMARQRITVTDGLPSIVATIPFRDNPVYTYSILSCLPGSPEVQLHRTANVELNAPDARPMALGASFSGYSLIDILFNVPMDPETAGDMDNYEVFESTEPGVAVALESAELQKDDRTVRLVTSTALSEGVDYTARMTGIENEVGTAIYPGSEITFSALDEESPHVVSVAMSAQRTIDVLFNEPVDELSACSMANYEIAESSNPSNRKSLYSAILLEDGFTARLTINSLFEDGTAYTVTVRNLTDVHGNTMQQGETVEFFADDIYPPEVLYVVSLPGGNSIRIYFNEPLDQVTAGDPGNYYFVYPSVGVVSVTWESSASVVLVSSGFSFGGSYNLYMRDVEDAEGNAMPDGKADTFYYTPEVPLPQIGLWSDITRLGSFVESQPFIPFEFYVWCRPGPNGIKAMEFALADRSIRDFRYGIMSVEYDPDYTVPLGEPFSGITIGVAHCKDDWFWMVKCTAFLIEGSGYIEVVPHPITGGPIGLLCIQEVVQFETVQELMLSAVVATLLQSYSAEYAGGEIAVKWRMNDIDEGVEFAVLRKAGGSGQFAPTPSQEVSRDGMEFEFVDGEIERGISYRYRIDYYDEEGIHTLFETDPVETPAYSLTLAQNRPNPFNPSTVIGFSLPRRSSVRLEIFDTAGRLVKVLRDGVMDAGEHEVVWDGTNSAGAMVGSGVYFCLLRAGKQSVSNKMILLR
jgi:hypothetical protein